MSPRAARDGALALRTTDLLVLAVLDDGPQHGYAVAQEIGRRTQGRVQVRPGDLYRVLYRLHEAGLIEDAPAASRADDRRSAYRLTPQGRRAGRDQATMLSHALAPLVARARGARSTP